MQKVYYPLLTANLLMAKMTYESDFQTQVICVTPRYINVCIIN